MPDIASGIETLVAPWTSDRKYRSFMLKVAEQIKSEDLFHLKYVLSDRIPARVIERLDSPLEVFSELEKRLTLGPKKLEVLREIFEDIDRPHLIKMVDEFDDSFSSFPLKPKQHNYLEMDGYRLSIDGGRHFETSAGEFVEVRSGSNYAMTFTNNNRHRGILNIKVDGFEMYPGGFIVNPGRTFTFERPSRETKKFKFFAVSDAPKGSGINPWKKDVNGVIQVHCTPERADMKIICRATGHLSQVFTCSSQTTDSEFKKMVATSFNTSNVTIIVGCKPLGNRDVALTEYGITNGSQLTVNLGGKGGVAANKLPSVQYNPSTKKDRRWRAGATTLEDESCQEFGSGNRFPVEADLAVTLNLRLVVRSDERSLPSSGSCTPLARATLIPPPVPT